MLMSVEMEKIDPENLVAQSLDSTGQGAYCHVSDVFHGSNACVQIPV